MSDFLHYEQDGDMWTWFWHSWTDGKAPDGGWYVSQYFRTNREGCGIFFVDLKHSTRRQIVGTCDFSLRDLKDPRRKIRDYFGEHIVC